MLVSYRYDTLLEALNILKTDEPARTKQLRLTFVGETPAGLGKRLKELDLSDIVELRGPTSHDEIVRLHRMAHGFLVLGRSSELRGYELLVGAKLFEYLKGGRPIIGVLPSDETKNILQRLGVKTIADVNSTSQILTLLRQVLDAWSTNTLSMLVPERKLCERYSVEAQVVALTRALEGKPPVEAFVPGSANVPSSLKAYIENEDWVY
jgi:glycosyltransferase involved in cell wall biosynthesis